MMKVAVVILNWNGQHFLEQFLPSVLKFSSDSAHVVVADNASTDNSVEFLRERFPQVEILEFPENGGFSKGYNDALKQVDAEYYVLLNSDVEVTEGWLEPMLEVMESDASIGACQPKILCHHDKSLFEYAGGAGGFIDSYGYPFCRGRIFDVLEKDEGQYDEPCDIFWATGASLFVRASLYHKLGGLDESFFAHMEEIDFCWRMKNAGHRLVVCPESKVYHVGGGSLPKSSPRKTYLNFRNNLLLLVKNLPSFCLGWVLFVRFFLDMLAAGVFLMKGQGKDFFAVLKAYFSFWSMFPGYLKKRRMLVQRRVSEMYCGNLVFEHFVHRVTFFSQLNKKKWF